MYYLREDHTKKKVEEIQRVCMNIIATDSALMYLYEEMKKDDSLYLHSSNVAELSCMIGLSYLLTVGDLIDLYLGAFFHDIGKLKLNKDILYKEGVLNDMERAYVGLHPLIGYKLLSHATMSQAALDIVRYHHEKINGTGYPEMLSGIEIPVLAQIATVADIFEALQADRCYRKAFPMQKIEKGLKKDKGLNQIFVRILLEGIACQCEEHMPVETAAPLYA